MGDERRERWGHVIASSRAMNEWEHAAMASLIENSAIERVALRSARADGADTSCISCRAVNLRVRSIKLD